MSLFFFVSAEVIKHEEHFNEVFLVLLNKLFYNNTLWNKILHCGHNFKLWYQTDSDIVMLYLGPVPDCQLSNCRFHCQENNS